MAPSKPLPSQELELVAFPWSNQPFSQQPRVFSNSKAAPRTSGCL